MRVEKKLTARKMRPVLFIYDEKGFASAVILKSDGTFRVQGDWTNSVEPTERHPWPDEREADFIAAYEAHRKAEAERLAAEKSAREQAEKDAAETEEARIAKTKEWIADCVDVETFADRFDIRGVNTAKHWNQLYAGTCGTALLMRTDEDVEAVNLAVEMGLLKGKWGEAVHRAGEHHHGFTQHYNVDSIDSYRQLVENHIVSKWSYRDIDTEREHVLEQVQGATSIEEAKEFIDKWETMDAGYYCDTNGGLMLDESDLNAHNFTGYCDDVYTYTMAFQVDTDESFKQPEYVVEVKDKDGRIEGYLSGGEIVDEEDDADVWADRDEAAEAMQSFAMSAPINGTGRSFCVEQRPQ